MPSYGLLYSMHQFDPFPGPNNDDLLDGLLGVALESAGHGLAFVLRGLDAFAHRAERRARYEYERRDRELKDCFLARVRALQGTPEDTSEAYWAAVQDFTRAREELREERDRGIVREMNEEAAARYEETHGRLPPWASPRAGAYRRRRIRETPWARWERKIENLLRARHGLRPFLPPLEDLPPPPVRRGAPIRRLCERSLNPAPTPEALEEQFEKARGRGRIEEKIRLGSMMLDLEASVDSSLIRGEGGEIVGRNPGLRGWIAMHCPALARRYATLLSYRRMAQDFRRAHGLDDPAPAALLLSEGSPLDAGLPPWQARALPTARRKAREALAAATTAKAFSAELRARFADPASNGARPRRRGSPRPRWPHGAPPRGHRGPSGPARAAGRA